MYQSLTRRSRVNCVVRDSIALVKTNPNIVALFVVVFSMSEDQTFFDKLDVKINFGNMSQKKKTLIADFFHTKIELCSTAVFLGVFSIS